MRTSETPGQFDALEPHDHRWGVILAGGDGTRLLPLTRRIAGDDRPKQFCALLCGETLLSRTQRRVARSIEPRRTALVVTKAHERFYSDQAPAGFGGPLLVQPSNRGTTPAILGALLLLRELDPAAVVGIFPSDHHFEDEEGFAQHLDLAFQAAESASHPVTLLGVAPECPEVAYGWIEPGAPLAGPGSGSLFRVNRFWEKPPLKLASALIERGCLWNTFIMVGRIHCFLNLIWRALPGMFALFEPLRSAWGTAAEEAALAQLYSRIAASNFSAEVLTRQCSGLAVLPSHNLGWSDLGEADRVLSVLRRKGAASPGVPASARELGFAG